VKENASVRLDPAGADGVLRDGSIVRIRPAARGDASSIRAFLAELSERSHRLRFGSRPQDVDAIARDLVRSGPHSRVSLVATAGLEQAVVGHAGFDVPGQGSGGPEIAIVVADEYQGRGLGTLLLGRLADIADRAGIGDLHARLVPENDSMLEFTRDSGLSFGMRSEPGVVHLEISTSPTAEARDRFERREEIAAAAAVRALLCPRSVAVIGASRKRHTPGGELFHNLIDGGFAGPVYPVNPTSGSVQEVRSFASVLDIPDELDVAIVAVPAEQVAQAARDCARKGVKGLIVVSAGFAEIGPSGAQRQAELLAVCREAGLRLIGPNCMGVVNTRPDLRMNAQFAPIAPLMGKIGVLSQSGALGLALMFEANRLGLGLSSFVSVGNQADISGDDLLCYWEDDAQTGLILLYLEEVANPRRFARIARRVSRSKPIVAVKSGRSAAGARATSSHTGALIGASDVTVDALFRQTGVIRTDTLAELFDVSALLSSQPIPAGRRVGILTNGGGPGILAADACESAGLQVPRLADDVSRRLAETLPAAAGVSNPVDMIASATADDYARATEMIAADPGIDALIVISGPPLVTPADDVAAAIRTVASRLRRPIPILAVFMSTDAPPANLRGDRLAIPYYAYPENAARALGHAAQYGAWRAASQGAVPRFEDIHREQAVAAVAHMLVRGAARWLDPAEVRTLLDCYGLPLVEQTLVRTPDEAAAAARRLGGPVALKGIAPTVVHKSEAQGVRLGLIGAAEVEAAARQMVVAFGAAGHEIEGFLVQRMAASGVEMLVGVVNDRLFGPVVACAAGGTQAELLKDVSVRITPLTDADARQMVRSLATFPLLDGYRGAPRADVPALEDVLLRVSAMVEAHPEIAEMDLNPVIVLPDGAVIVDARIRIEAP
jgi:acetyl coenzyme A synthetase (ADP forming)-like protein